MIHRLEIDNFALVERAELDLGPGLTVLSGETGAGKSILIDALDFASGSRSDRSMLRTGAREASVTLLVQDSKEGEREEILVSRTLKEGGRSYAKLNGQLVTVSDLRDRMESLLAIHSQNDQQSIFRESVHRELLDAYGGKTIFAVLDEWALARQDLEEIERGLAALFLDPETRARRRDILAFQVSEIEEADLQAGEDEALMKKIKTLTAVREISVLLSRAWEELSGGEGGAASDRLGRALTDLHAASRYSSRVQELVERGEQLRRELNDLAYDLSRMADRLDDRPEELEEANQRLLLLRRLQDKYGASLDQVIEYGQKARLELDRLDETEEDLARLTLEKSQTLDRLASLADKLRRLREEAGWGLEKAINCELDELDMKNASFEVEIEDRFSLDKGDLTDPQQVRFMIAPNPGEPSMPLVSIISGGEASRVLLAIKTVLAGLDRVATLVFDEIDTGISGRTTTRIADKLKAIARHAQVICVTHNAQIAAAADVQLLIGKRVDQGRTRTFVNRIEGEERVAELARLLSGRPDDEKSKVLARDLLRRGQANDDKRGLNEDG